LKLIVSKLIQYSKNEIGKELQQNQVNLEAAQTALELNVRQNQYTTAQTQELARTEQIKREEETQKVLDLQVLLQNEKDARQKDVASLENILKLHQTHMIQTNDLVSTLPEPLLPAVQQRLLDLQALIDANVPNDAKWIYTENPSEWPKYFSSASSNGHSRTLYTPP
jgi:hypothetical protein